jgi:hypothetical protein
MTIYDCGPDLSAIDPGVPHRSERLIRRTGRRPGTRAHRIAISADRVGYKGDRHKRRCTNQITLDRSRHVRQMPSGRKMGGRVAANQRTSSLTLENAPHENIDYFCFVLPISLFKLHNN